MELGVEKVSESNLVYFSPIKAQISQLRLGEELNIRKMIQVIQEEYRTEVKHRQEKLF